MFKDRLPTILFGITLFVFLIVLVMYLKTSFTGQKGAPESGKAPQASVSSIVAEPPPLPEKIYYTITEVLEDRVKVKTDKGTATYTKAYMEDKGIYKMVDGTRQDLTFADLSVDQKMTVHTQDGKLITGFEMVD